jgi:Tfp pilus assembly protein PilF
MTRTLLLAALACAALIAAGCSATYVRQSGMQNAPVRPPERMLLAGLKQYEDGDLKAAQASLHRALAEGLAFEADRVTAHKYLAFIECASGRERECRDQFAAALALDPRLELSRAEAGHPVWGPAFRSTKATIVPSK